VSNQSKEFQVYIMKRLIMYATIIFLIQYNHTYSWEHYDRVIAVVNDTPIIESEVLIKFDRLKKLKKISKKKFPYELSRIIDNFIENAIVIQKANEESIIVSDAKIDNQIEKMMKSSNIDNLKDFKKSIEVREKLSFEEYKKDLKVSLIKQQVISIAIGVSPPTKQEALEWYRKYKSKLGYQVNMKHILLRPKNRTFAEEKRVNKRVNSLRNRIVSGESFESLARRYSEDPTTAKKGGDLGWVMLAELDPFIAGYVFKMNKKGQISRVIKSRYGYHIVKFLGKRLTPFDSVRDKILNLLFQVKVSKQFKKWVSQKKRQSDIIIYMEDYVRG
jgi:putative peptidyl-prolyl cis-trans isomerase